MYRFLLKALLIAAMAGLANSRPVELQPIAVIEAPSAAIEFARNSGGAMGVDSMGRAHLTYFSPDEGSRTPNNAIWYVVIENEFASPSLRVDDGDVGGGRHPTLTVDETDAVYIAWSDYRHSTPAGSWIDNLEIYYNKQPMGGEFAAMGTRVSWTEAGHQGDNGYAPKIAAANGRAFIAWYDFHITGHHAHIYVRSSDANGVFESRPGIEAYRITGLESPIDQGSRWLPDLALLNEDSLLVIWGYNDSNYQREFALQGRRVGLDGALGPIEAITDIGGTFFDPPRLAVDSDGRAAVAYMRREAGRSNIFLQFRAPAGDWTDAIQLNDGDYSSTQPVIRSGADGVWYAIWQEDLGGVWQATLAKVDIESGLITRQVVSGFEDDIRSPVIALHPITDALFAAWINRDFEGRRSIVVLREPHTAVDDWALF